MTVVFILQVCILAPVTLIRARKINTLTSEGGDDIFILKLDADCKFIWARSIGGSLSDVCGAMDIDQSGSGTVYITGFFHGLADFDPGTDTFYMQSKANADLFILALNKSGEFIWARSVGGSGNENGRAIKTSLNSNGNIYISGAFQNTVDFDPGPEEAFLKSNGSYDMFLLCLDLDGHYKWVRSFGGTGQDFGTALAIASGASEELLLVGGFSGTVDFATRVGSEKKTSLGPQDIFISRYHSNGDLLWTKTLGGLTSEYATSLTMDPKNSNDICIAGFFQGNVDFDPGTGVFNKTSNGSQDLFLLSLDDSGLFKWVYTAGGAGLESVASIGVDPSGNGDVYGTGYFQQIVNFNPGPDSLKLISAGSYDMFLLKLDSTGKFQWVKSAGGSSLETGSSLNIGKNSEVYVCGDFYSSPVTFDSLTVTNTNSASSTSDIFIAALNKPNILNFATPIFSNIEIYPVPASDVLHINFKDDYSDLKALSVHVYDYNGKIKQNFTLDTSSKNVKIDISRLLSGFYILEIIMNHGIIQRKILISTQKYF
jgi:hypothetical protein